MIAEAGTRIDWWIITRDTIFFMIYLIMITVFLSYNDIGIWQAVVLLCAYLIHIMLMKFNHLYEVAIKKSVARAMEIKELTRIAHKEIGHFHKNLNSRQLTIEMLKSVDYRVEEKYIIFDSLNRKKIKDPCVVLKDDRIPFSMLDNKSFVSRILWKKATIKIIIRIQAYKHYEKMKRSEKSKIPLSKILTFLNDNRPDNSIRDSESSVFYDGDYPEKVNDTLSIRDGGRLKEVSSLMRKKQS